MAAILSFTKLMGILNGTLGNLSDHRTGKNTTYTIQEAGLSAFSVFFTQSPSFLAHQRDMQRRQGRNNAASLFGLQQIPSDPQIRNLLDPIDPAHLRAPFWEVFTRLGEGGYLEAHCGFAGNWLCALDGTQYFSSTKVHCPNCTVQIQGDVVHYSHVAITPVLVAPGREKVITLEPEFITPQDGQEKQDCERNAAKRWLERNAHRFAAWQVTLLGDDLYCNQPFCEMSLAHKFNFILVCKPESHETLYEEVALLTKISAVAEVTDRHWNGREHELWRYRYVNQVPLRRGQDALPVNWCELTILQAATGELLYRNAFATNHWITEQTVRPIVASGRARWKIENENNNVLKNNGYHLEHNYGHGQQHLSAVLVTLNLLAFLFHTTLDQCDRKYHQLRTELGARVTFFNDIRALTRYLFFKNWDHLLDFMCAGLELELDSSRPPDSNLELLGVPGGLEC